jgi:energy-converting hydrogenase Eha subunit E
MIAKAVAKNTVTACTTQDIFKGRKRIIARSANGQPRREIDRDSLAGRSEFRVAQQVIISAAIQHIIAGTRSQGIGPGIADQSVIAILTMQQVSAIATSKTIIAFTAKDAVITIPAGQ